MGKNIPENRRRNNKILPVVVWIKLINLF
jgi:hypothetical protein